MLQQQSSFMQPSVFPHHDSSSNDTCTMWKPRSSHWESQLIIRHVGCLDAMPNPKNAFLSFGHRHSTIVHNYYNCHGVMQHLCAWSADQEIKRLDIRYLQKYLDQRNIEAYSSLLRTHSMSCLVIIRDHYISCILPLGEIFVQTKHENGSDERSCPQVPVFAGYTAIITLRGVIVFCCQCSCLGCPGYSFIQEYV